MALSEVSPQIEDLINRLYRRKSLDLHPDRHAEMIEEWELLKMAKSIIGDPKSRHE
jgi:DnaJ-class molecular chaperone